MSPVEQTNQNNSSPSAPFDWRDIPAFAGAIGVASLALALARDTGFFWMLDRRLLGFFSFQDVLRTALVFIPQALIFALLGLLIGALAPKAARFVAHSDKPGRELLFALVASLFALLFLPLWASSISWIVAFNFWFLWAWLDQKFNFSRTASLFVVGVLLLAFWVLQGMSEAQSTLAAEEYKFQLNLKDGSQADVNVLRTTTDFFIVRQNASDVWAVPRSEVTMLKRKELEKPRPLVSVPGPTIWTYLRDRWCEQCRL